MVLITDPAPERTGQDRAAARTLQGRHRFAVTRTARARLLQGTLSFAVVSWLAFNVRSIGLSRGFELWVDEMLYADLGKSVSLGQLPNLPDGPFFLHPPGFFLLEGWFINLNGISDSGMDLV